MRYSIDTRLGILQLVSYTRNSCTPLMSAAFRLEVTSLPINPSIRNKLLCSGFRSSADLDGIGPVDLATGNSFFVLAAHACLIEHLFQPVPLQCLTICRVTAEAQLTHEEALLVLKLALPNSGNSLDGVFLPRHPAVHTSFVGPCSKYSLGYLTSGPPIGGTMSGTGASPPPYFALHFTLARKYAGKGRNLCKAHLDKLGGALIILTGNLDRKFSKSAQNRN